MKPDRSSQTGSWTAPSDKIAAEKFDKERKARPEKPYEVAVHNRQLTSQKDVSRNGKFWVFGLSLQQETNYISLFTQKLKYLQEVAMEIKSEAAKRRTQERYPQEGNG